MSIAGSKRDHTDAAIITPDVNPSNRFSSFLLIVLFIKNTRAEPSDVPIKGIIRPITNIISHLLMLVYAEGVDLCMGIKNPWSVYLLTVTGTNVCVIVGIVMFQRFSIIAPFSTSCYNYFMTTWKGL